MPCRFSTTWSSGASARRRSHAHVGSVRQFPYLPFFSNPSLLVSQAILDIHNNPIHNILFVLTGIFPSKLSWVPRVTNSHYATSPTSSLTYINASFPSHPQESQQSFCNLADIFNFQITHTKLLRTMSIVVDAPGFFQVFSDGSIKRDELETSPASTDSSSNGYKSKDVIIDSTKPISGRIFLPDTPASSSFLPVLVYFHGGAFCVGTTAWVGYHTFLGDFSVASRSIVLSVDYRLAPEYRLPTAYDDCYCSLEWLSKLVSSEPWLQRADLSRVFLSGESAGGNIVHNVALKLIQEKTYDHVKIKGLLPIHPYFGSEERIEKEKTSESAKEVATIDSLWKLILPEGSNRDYFGCNFETAELSRDEWGRFPAVVVYVAGLDFLKERGVMYADFLKKKGVEVKMVEAEGEQHGYHIFHPKSESTRLLQKQMSEFIHSF